MCVVSMVYDHYDKVFPIWPPTPVEPFVPTPALSEQISGLTVGGGFQIISQQEVDALRKLIADFREAVEAAKKVDALTSQLNCEDHEKKKLEDRVVLLEQQIAQMSKPTKTSKPRKNTKQK